MENEAQAAVQIEKVDPYFRLTVTNDNGTSASVVLDKEQLGDLIEAVFNAPVEWYAKKSITVTRPSPGCMAILDSMLTRPVE